VSKSLVDYRQYRAVYLACRSAVPLAWPLDTLPVLANGAFFLAGFFGLVFLLTGYWNGWAILAGIVTGTLIRTIHEPLSRSQQLIDEEVDSFAERFSAALVPVSPVVRLTVFACPPGVVAELIRNAARRAARTEGHRLARRLNSLKIISSSAPFFGLLATVFGIVGSFRGGSGSRESLFFALVSCLTEAIVPTALGLAVGILAFASHRFLNVQRHSLEVRMDSFALALANALRR
jgi:biopolymer transport protein ExbB/TolQ